jgi:uncharacterized protein (TIGR02452 family)
VRQSSRPAGHSHIRQDPDEQNRLRRIAEETVSICNNGFYQLPSGGVVHIHQEVWHCVQHSRLYKPSHSFVLEPPANPGPGFIEIHEESVFNSCRRILQRLPPQQIVLLNFASATKPGGGFRNGRQVQEEAIARASALYPSIACHNEMYDFGQADSNPLYTDYMIYSPMVPFFRDDSGALLERPFRVSIITSAAPNAKECVAPTFKRAVRGTLKNRLRKVIQLAAMCEHRVLLLGAFGCGVFGNDPGEVATIEKELLFDERLGQYFDLIVNPITASRTNRTNVEAFRRVLAEFLDQQ